MSIYTRNGDFGYTTNFLGKKINKDSSLIHLQGQIDEVNSSIGYLRALVSNHKDSFNDSNWYQIVDESLQGIQKNLFRIGVSVTTGFKQTYIQWEDIQKLEKGIDDMTALTGELKNFIYLSGHETAAYAHVVRAIIRRSERFFATHIKSLGLSEVPVEYQYVNRLADYIYQLARLLNNQLNFTEEIMTL